MPVIATEYALIPTPAAPVRAFVARPRDAPRPLPAVIAWPDIFQLTEPHLRLVRRLAGHGFLVVAPEIYARIEPAGTVLDFERDRQRALDDAARVQPAWVDEERRAVLAWMASRSDIDPARLGACGFCFGGHLAFRAALEPEVRAAACCYATGVHNGQLGAAQGTAGTLERVAEIQGALLLVWGRDDPHIPAAGRSRIHRALEDAGTRLDVRLYDAEHAFMRDEGPRYEPAAADHAFGEIVALFRARLARG